MSEADLIRGEPERTAFPHLFQPLKIRGVELEGQFRATDNLTLSASYAYTDAKVPDTINPFNGVSQQVFIAYTPENAGSVAADWNSPFMGATLKAHIDANYADAAALMTGSSIVVDGGWTAD